MTPSQLSLLDPGPRLPVRSTDPVTSLIAAKRINFGKRKRQVMHAAATLGASFTAEQVVRLVGDEAFDIGSVRSRLAQLRTDGLVENLGIGAGRFDNKVQTWRLTPTGREWLAGEQ